MNYMDYSKYLGDLVNEPKNIWDEAIEPVRPKNLVKEYEFIRPRLGLPEDMIPWEENSKDIALVLKKTFEHGHIVIPRSINSKLRMSLEHFRNNLDIYDLVVDKKVFSTLEIFERCLREGPSYTNYIKKCRAFSLQNATAIGGTNIKDEYIHDEYCGYDSILHERYLVYWDDREDVADWVYSLVDPPEDDRSSEFAAIAKRLSSRWKWEVDKDLTVPMLPDIAGKASSLNSEKQETTLLKNTWAPSDGEGAWFATRRVVPASGNQTRDTGVPDVDTLIKLKMIHQAVRKISNGCEYSANCDGQKLTRRVLRVQNCKRFTHIDFKKFGLTYLRSHLNNLLSILGLQKLRVEEFYLNTDRGLIQTERGTVLGWLDPLASLVVILILHDLKEKMAWEDMDFITFNDDIEVGWKVTDPAELIKRQMIIVSRLEYFGFIMSHRKIYTSELFVFLEQYEYPGYLDMTKKQLCVNHFAKSLSSPYTWEAKTNFAAGWKVYRNWRIKEICQNSIINVFGEIEYSLPVELGGWTHKMSGFLNVGLVEADPGEISFFIKMSKWKRPQMTEKYIYVSIEELYRRKTKMIAESIKASTIEKNVEYDEPLNLSIEEIHRLEILSDSYTEITKKRVSLYDDSKMEGIPDG